ncbi:MAG: hypothetical protein V3U43_00315 [Pseudomonadales bacterium]
MYGGIPSINEPVDAYEADRIYREVEELRTFGRSPYGFYVFGHLDDGGARVDQAVPMRFWTPHGLSYSPKSIAIGVHGDFRREHASPDIVQATTEIIAMLFRLMPWCNVLRHDEPKNPPASGDLTKICPGDGLPVAQIAADARKMVLDGAAPRWLLS